MVNRIHAQAKRKLGLIVNPIAGLVLSSRVKAGYAAGLGSREATAWKSGGRQWN